MMKISAVKALSQTLRRYTGLNHLAQAARAVLQNSAQITQVRLKSNFASYGFKEYSPYKCKQQPCSSV